MLRLVGEVCTNLRVKGVVIRPCTHSAMSDPILPKGEDKPMIMGAIENGNPSSDSRVLPNQPRPPRDMKGLLRFAMEATAMEDAPNSSNLQPMDESVR